MPLTWADIAEHRNRLTPLQWERLQAFLHEGQSLMQIGGPGRNGFARSSLNQSIGRAAIAILRGLLGQPDPRQYRRGNKFTKDARSDRTTRPHDSNSPRLSGSQEQEEEQRGSAGVGSAADTPNVSIVRNAPSSSFLPFAELANLIRDHSGELHKSTAVESKADCSQPIPQSLPQKLDIVQPKMRVEGSHKGGSDTGRVETVTGSVAVVVWDSGFKTLTPVAQLTPLAR